MEKLISSMQLLGMSVDPAFTKLQSNGERVNFCYNALAKANRLVDPGKVEKCETKANAAREKGNKFYRMDFPAALECYNESLCLAPKGSKAMALAYANRSQVYFKSKFYNLCLENIELALENGYPETLKPNLCVRKEACLQEMQSKEDSLDTYKSPPPLELSHAANPKIPFVIDALKVATDDQYGRYIVTTKDLNPGDVVLVEEPYIQYIKESGTYSHCFICLTNAFFNLRPCAQSTKIMFCSEKCEKEASEGLYKYIFPVIDDLLEDEGLIVVCALKAFTLFGNPTELRDFIKTIDVQKENGFDVDYKKNDEKEKFKAFYALQTNENKTDISYIYKLCIMAARIWHIVKEVPEFQTLVKSEDELFKELLLHFTMIITTNSHDISSYERVNVYTQKPYQPKSAAGVSLIYSLFSHSCSPNVNRVHVVDRYGVVVTRPIKAGQQLFDNYGPLYCDSAREERRETLKYRYNFHCTCEACENNYGQAATGDLVDQKSIPVPVIFKMMEANKTGRYDDKMYKDICRRSAAIAHRHPCWDTYFLQETLIKAIYAKIAPKSLSDIIKMRK